MKTRISTKAHTNLIELEDVIANYAGDMALTPDGLHYLGMTSWVTEPLAGGVHFPVPAQPIRKAS